jgi:pyrroline-5-carboxylate reductase
VNIALTGCGAMGERVAAQVYAQGGQAGYRLAAAIDPRAERAQAVGDALGVRAYPSVGAAAVAAGRRSTRPTSAPRTPRTPARPAMRCAPRG